MAVQRKLLNLITLGQAQTDNINRMIIKTDSSHTRHTVHTKHYLGVCQCDHMSQIIGDYIKRLPLYLEIKSSDLKNIYCLNKTKPVENHNSQ
jgi:hypothetical protein